MLHVSEADQYPKSWMEDSMHDKQHPDPFSQLRKKAEARLVQIPPVKAARTAEELLYELQVHQIELEIQNESLREAKIALEDSRDRYLDLYESAPVAYLTIDLSGRISEINLTGAILLAENRGKICQSEFERFVMPSYQGLWRQQFRQALKGDGQQTYELKMRRSNGASFDGHLYCSRVIVSDASPELRIALADITNQKTADAARRLLEPRLHQLTRR